MSTALALAPTLVAAPWGYTQKGRPRRPPRTTRPANFVAPAATTPFTNDAFALLYEENFARMTMWTLGKFFGGYALRRDSAQDLVQRAWTKCYIRWQLDGVWPASPNAQIVYVYSALRRLNIDDSRRMESRNISLNADMSNPHKQDRVSEPGTDYRESAALISRRHDDDPERLAGAREIVGELMRRLYACEKRTCSSRSMTKRACEQYGSVQRRIEIMLTMYLRSVSGETLRGTSEHLRIEYGIDLPPNLLKTYLTRLRIRFRPVLVQVAMAYDLADIVSFDQRNDVAGHNVHIISVRDEIRRALARGSIPHD